MSVNDASFVDPYLEWKWLATAAQREYNTYVKQVKEINFTDERKPVFAAFKELLVTDGYVTLDGVESILGVLPGELLAAGQGNIKALTRSLIKTTQKRELKDKSDKLRVLAYSANPDMSEARSIMAYEPISTVEDSTMTNGVNKFTADLRAKLSGNYEHIRTGLKFLDKKIGGEYRPGTLTIIMGQPGMGKTTFACNSMLGMAMLGKPIPSLLFSQEMLVEDLTGKWLADMTEIDYSKILSGEKLTQIETNKIDEAMIKLQQLPMYTIDRRAMPFEDILYNIREHVEQKGVRAVFIDYMQIVNYSTGDQVRDLGYIAQMLVSIAGELGIAVIGLAQVTESNEGLDRFRGSRIPTQHAHVVGEIQLEPAASANDTMRWGKVEIWKNRYGMTGSFPIVLQGSYQRFMGAEDQ